MIIGEDAVVDAFGISFEGRIIDETKNMLALKREKKVIMLPKEVSVIRTKDRIIEGKNIRKRLWERVHDRKHASKRDMLIKAKRNREERGGI
ncbi:MAG: hypothetical protein SVE93_01545 [Candidatus Thermoplasmatota archaeon]|nr:hypothetical protein [Candidatus Thermoplasmatota archaeon]